MRNMALVALLLGQLAFAEGTIEVPGHAKFVKLEVETAPNTWMPIEVPRKKSRKVTLPAGVYRYEISIESATLPFRGTMTVSDGSHQYVHRAITPDRDRVFSWVSPNSPRSETFEVEQKEHFCMGVLRVADPTLYMLNACTELAADDNQQGLFGLGYLYENWAGMPKDLAKASANYKRAYEMGNLQAGAAFFVLHQEDPEGREVLLDVASRGHPWSIGIAGQVLAASNDPEDRARSRAFAEQSIDLLDPIGFRNLAQLALIREHENTQSMIEAAAWFNLYSIHEREGGYGSSRFKLLLEEALLTEDQPAIRRKTIELADKHIQSNVYVLVDSSELASFAKEGELSLLLNNEFTMPLQQSGSHFLELWPSDRYFSVMLKVEDQFEDSISFFLGEDGATVHCLRLKPSRTSIEVTTNTKNDNCPDLIADDAVSMWEVMDQYF